MTEKVWRVEYDNECPSDGEGGSGFYEWWTVTDGERTFRASYQDDAELLAAALNAYPGGLSKTPPVPKNDRT